ncbi:MAG: FAD-dependent oxidoreductase [Phycisphaerae bacterium]|nr:FAD-dependent oxidoreductase [Phycisphaerae bacterium]
MAHTEHPVAVIGAGVVGLASAIRLREAGHPVTLFARDRTPETTSDRSGAIFSPYRIDGSPSAAQWTTESFAVFAALADDSPTASGVTMGRMRELFVEPLDADPWWSDIVEDFERLHNPPAPYVDGVRCILPKMNIPRYVPWLEERFVGGLSGCIVTETIASFQQLFDRGYHVIVNCSGLGARELAHDAAMTPYRGQILRIRNTIGLSECLLEGGDDPNSAVGAYVFPFDDFVVLGGTFERGEENPVTEAAAIDGIVRRCAALLKACNVANAERLAADRIAALAGIRPCRDNASAHEAVRLERESLDCGRTIIHNYGHGRAGVTLSWGCAAEVVRLLAT